MKQQKTTQLNCFSPPIMVITLLIEVALAVYAIWRYKMTVVTRLVAFILVALGTFQLAEYFVCTGQGFSAEHWSRLGFVAITTLPALSIHLMHLLANKPGRRTVALAYATMTAFIVYFLVSATAFVGHECTGNYVIFQIGNVAAIIYGLYYYGWILAGIILGTRWVTQFTAQGKTMIVRAESIKGMIIGYLVFLVPTAVASTVNPSTRDGIPSIMCGFAVLYALILALYVLPRAVAKKNRPKN